MGKVKRKPKQEQVEEGSPAWMLTYGDLMTQILIFFVMLFSMSTLDEIKVKAVEQSISDTFGFQPTTLEIDVEEPNVYQVYAAKLRAGALSNGIAGQHLHVETVDRGIKISIGGKILFDKHSAEIKSEAFEKLSEVADFVRGYDTKIVIIGHCGPDPLPQDSSFRDKWELSWRRAYNVGMFLQNSRIKPHRIRIEGAAQHEPAEIKIFDQTDINRRVELIVTEERVYDKME